MKNKGFTLIELLAVIVILAIIALIATPMILNVIEKARVGSAESSALGYIDAVEKQISINLLDKELDEIKEGTYVVEELDTYNVKVKGTKPSSGEIIITNKVNSATLCIGNYKVEYKENKAVAKKDSSCITSEEQVLYKENILNGTEPVIGKNMIPVIIENDGVVKKADLYNKWYHYASKKWANAVILIDESKTYETNEVIPESNIESYFVWIPRYKYKLWNVDGTTTGAREIEIIFENKEATVSNGMTNGDYLTHPAFTTFNTNGIWVGKFETGYSGATSTSAAQVNSSDSSKIIVKPNVYSWRGNALYNFFVSSYNYKRDLDSHMIKNTEWGAVAYLSHSKYGINDEVRINNNSSYLTGCGANSVNEGGITMCQIQYGKATNYPQSTNGNITGIYDMNGGAWEYMASYVSGRLGNSGFTSSNLTLYNSNYFDVYNGMSTEVTYQYRILGDATGEQGPFVSSSNSWYGDGSIFITPASSWFIRGGNYSDSISAGQFNFFNGNGSFYNVVSSRLILAPQ